MDESNVTKGFVHAVYNESPYGIIVFNSKFTIVDWNPAVATLIGLAKDDCMGKQLFDVFNDSSQRVSALQNARIKATLVVSEHLSGHFINSLLGDVKVSIIVDRSGAVNGGTLILTAWN